MLLIRTGGTLVSAHLCLPHLVGTPPTIQITCSDGTHGWGDGGQWGAGEPIKAAVESVLAPRIIGKRVQPTVLWEEMYVTKMCITK
jgi:L-alanine-DL-glutamate epimerase-like enolase superfamily enzyme